MRCPKCSYLSYDDLERCRNCGYDFSLATASREVEAPTPVDPPPETRTWEPTRRRRPGVTDTSPPTEGSPIDLPLFEDPTSPEPPPVAIPPAGPPLSVRRRIEITRTPPRREPVVEPPAEPAGFDWPDEPVAAPHQQAPTDEPPGEEPPVADLLGPRLRAGVIDFTVIALNNLAIVWLTMKVAGVTAEEWRLLPLVPLVGFLFLLDTAYLVTFTAASGQTIGKMIAGLRVVYGADARVPFGHAVLRSVALLLCAVPAGLGLLPIVFDQERRGAHDRLAGTRVVPAS